MASRLTVDFERVFRFVHSRVPVPLAQGMRAIGVERDGQVVAGALFEGYNGRNVWIHLAGEGPGWVSRPFIRACMRYVWIDLGCARISCHVVASNRAAIRFNEHFGWRREAVLAGAAADGGDMLVYVMTREECRHAFE
jgi:RimJ/RimL family protein N-acetyltransferase